MKTLIISVASMAIIGLGACSQASAPETTQAAKTPAVQDANVNVRTKAVLVYADWCGSCKVLDPKVQKLKAAGAVSGIDYVTLDYTDKNDANFFASAEAAGVGPAVKAHLSEKVKTGQLLLIDMDDQKVVDTITKTADYADMVSMLQAAVNAS